MVGDQQRRQGRGGAMQHTGMWFLSQCNDKPLTVADEDNIRKSSTLAPVISRFSLDPLEGNFHGTVSMRSYLGRYGSRNKEQCPATVKECLSNRRGLTVMPFASHGSAHVTVSTDSRSLALLTGLAGKFMELD